ncbi:MAG: hypothetical protein KDB04_16400 [Acidimicrobiales bacterium]|nr:hypothetical protein [Acidimicrobiales bacterium]
MDLGERRGVVGEHRHDPDRLVGVVDRQPGADAVGGDHLVQVAAGDLGELGREGRRVDAAHVGDEGEAKADDGLVVVGGGEADAHGGDPGATEVGGARGFTPPGPFAPGVGGPRGAPWWRR